MGGHFDGDKLFKSEEGLVFELGELLGGRSGFRGRFRFWRRWSHAVAAAGTVAGLFVPLVALTHSVGEGLSVVSKQDAWLALHD